MAKNVSEQTAVDARLLEFEHRLQRIEESGGVSIAIATLGESTVRLLRPVPVTIRFNGDDFIASFFDANIHASGETEQEAFDGLREMLIGTFTLLDSHDSSSLSNEMQRSLRVLRQFIERAV